MAQCAGGSTTQAGAPTYFQFDTTTVASFLPFGSAIAFLGLLGLPVGPVDTAQFCSTEPPATTLTAVDVVALGIPAVAKLTGAYDRLGNYVQQKAFSTYCACVATGGTPYSTQILSLSPYWYWKMGDSSGTAAADASGHSRPGFYFGGALLGQPALITGDPSTSVSAGATGLVSTPAGASYTVGWDGGQDHSIEFFAKFTAPAAVGALYTNYDGVQALMSIRTDATGHVDIQCRDSAGTLSSSPYSTLSYSDGLVHQFDLVMNHTTHVVTLYVDAISVASVTGLSGLPFTGTGTNDWLLEDPHGTNTHIAGTAGHFSAYTTALAATTISDNRAAAGGRSTYNAPTYTPPADGTPPAGTAPTCSTNQDVCNVLATTNLLLQGVGVQLAEFSKRAAPVYWRTGTSHAGLTGTGVLSVLDTVGLRVQLTTVPAGWGSTAETPRRLIPSAGSIQAGYSSDYSDNWQLHYEDELILMEASWATQIRYNLRPGITATIVELQPGS